MERESDGDNNCKLVLLVQSTKGLVQGTGGHGNKRTGRDYLNCRIIEFRPEELMRTCCHSNIEELSANSDMKKLVKE